MILKTKTGETMKDRIFKATIKEPEPEVVLSTADYINFITENSDMDWNTVCDFIYENGYLSHELDLGNFLNTEIKKPSKKRIKDHGYDYEYEFVMAHPWTKKYQVRFIFD